MYKVREIEWLNLNHEPLKLYGIFKLHRRTDWRWHCLITDDPEYANHFLDADFPKLSQKEVHRV